MKVRALLIESLLEGPKGFKVPLSQYINCTSYAVLNVIGRFTLCKHYKHSLTEIYFKCNTICINTEYDCDSITYNYVIVYFDHFYVFLILLNVAK